MTSPTRGRGRPATIAVGDLARTALTLWDQRGYENVAMSEVAAAAGVNERTYFRYFASKSDVVWQAIGTSFGDLQRHLAAAPAAEPLIARIRLGVLASFELAEDPEVTRLRMRIISRTAELHSSSAPQFVAWRTVIQEFAAEHLGVPAADRTPLVVASCVQAATMSALIWWGAHGEGTPSDAVDLALRELENGFAGRLPVLLVDDHLREDFLDRSVSRKGGWRLGRVRPYQTSAGSGQGCPARTGSRRAPGHASAAGAMVKAGAVTGADSLAELAGKIGVPAGALAATVERWNTQPPAGIPRVSSGSASAWCASPGSPPDWSRSPPSR